MKRDSQFHDTWASSVKAGENQAEKSELDRLTGIWKKKAAEARITSEI